VGSCARSEPASSIQVLVGSAADERQSFVPVGALAEWIGAATAPSGLRVILSNRPLACRDPRALERRELRVTLAFEPPISQAITTGAFIHTHQPNALEGSDQPEAARVVPFVRLGERGFELPPGGQVELMRVETEEGGTVEGLLRLEQPGGVNVPATSVVGQFRARVCPSALP